MQVFAYLRQKKTDFKKTSLFALQKKQQRLDFVKNFFVIFSFVLCVVFYAITVTMSSTKWYFLAKAQQEKSKIQFSYNIETLNMSEYRKNLRDKLEWTTNIKKIRFNVDLAKNDSIIKFALKE